MFDLPTSEMVAFVLIVAAQVVAAVAATRCLRARGGSCRALVVGAVGVAVLVEGLLLVLRGVSIGAIPLTGPFESLILLALVFGVAYLLLSRVIEQVWFGLVMVWLLLGIVAAAGFFAGPASRAHAIAATPWAIAHAGAMILAAAAVVFATAASGLYLLGSHRLKHKQVRHVLGRIPNMETLAAMNRMGLGLGFVLLTAGVVTGLGLASSLGAGLATWLADGKVLCILAVWSLLGAILVWDRFFRLRIKVRAYVTIVAFGLILIATIGVTIVGATRHKFSFGPPCPGDVWVV